MLVEFSTEHGTREKMRAIILFQNESSRKSHPISVRVLIRQRRSAVRVLVDGRDDFENVVVRFQSCERWILSELNEGQKAEKYIGNSMGISQSLIYARCDPNELELT